MEEIYYAIAAVVYSIFIIRFCLSWIGMDFDVDTDLDISDIVSFKGLTHFLMGIFGWLSIKSYTTHDIQWYDYLIGFIVGILFVVILYLAYKFLLTLESKPEILSGKSLIGKKGKIYMINYDNCDKLLYEYIITVNNGSGTVELPAKSSSYFTLGNTVTIKDYCNTYYII